MALPLGGRGAPVHRPVLLRETIELLAVERGGLFVDCTVGLGGHSEAILQAADTQVIGIDRDEEALEMARKRLAEFGGRFRGVQVDFRGRTRVFATAKGRKVRGFLADLGVSSLQLDSPSRGFSFRHEAPLDMRMDTSSGETAAELLGRLSEVEIANLIFEFGEEPRSRRIARAIVQRRERGQPVATTTDLANVVERAVGRGNKRRIHPATRTFQALRIAVNGELENLDRFLFDAVDQLEPAGRLAVISFHSLEDRIVKRTLQKLSGRCQCPPRLPKCICGARKAIDTLTKRAMMPSAKEIDENPRARSAKLRGAQKI